MATSAISDSLSVLCVRISTLHCKNIKDDKGPHSSVALFIGGIGVICSFKDSASLFTCRCRG